MLTLIGLAVLLTVYGMREFARHQKTVRKIPVRIHVNGTRGKSSVVRLIAGALREGGLRTIAKTTGSAPRVILTDGSEISISRPRGANIIEQIKVIRYILKRAPQVMVIECMAVQPEYQWICEHQIVHATHGVITNARPDHVREMGPSLENITRSLCNTIPRKASVVTSEHRMVSVMKEVAARMGSDLLEVDEQNISDEEMNRFGHLEHKENVAIALAVARQLDVDRETALRGMYSSEPDIGALKVHRLELDDNSLLFINALAANDPESTYAIWQKVETLFGDLGTRIILLNSRHDRLERSQQLVEMLTTMEFDHLVLTGERVDKTVSYCYHWQIPESKVHKMDAIHLEDVYRGVMKLAGRHGTLMAIGNHHGGGGEIAHFLRERSRTE
ncbi:poly-gamma-glutamate synthase PgsB [bacterium]|nr:poly-gamma-glutamate synthase PgsB [bacterium]